MAIFTGVSVACLCALAVIGAVIDPHPSATSTQSASPQPVSIAPATSPVFQSTSVAPASTDANPAIRLDGGLDYLSLKAEAEEQLRGVLTDDHGVHYRDVHTKLSTLDGGGIVAFCGEENSRTPLGGYGGYNRFVASRSIAVTEAGMTGDDFEQADAVLRECCGRA